MEYTNPPRAGGAQVPLAVPGGRGSDDGQGEEPIREAVGAGQPEAALGGSAAGA